MHAFCVFIFPPEQQVPDRDENSTVSTTAALEKGNALSAPLPPFPYANILLLHARVLPRELMQNFCKKELPTLKSLMLFRSVLPCSLADKGWGSSPTYPGHSS